MKIIKRKNSVITGEKNLEHLVTYKKHPIFIGCTNQKKKKDLFVNMSFSICRDSGIIQLDNLIPLNILYSQYHSEAIGETWVEHHKRFIKFFSKFSPKNVLEIGGSNCFMASQYLKDHKRVRWMVVEPNPASPKIKGIKIISQVFDKNFKIKEKIDTVIHSHVLEHMYDPGKFLEKINFLLDDDSMQIFSVPNLYEYLNRGYSNCLNFEHTLFLTEYFIDFLLKKNGFIILEKKYFQNHSIFYATKKVGNPKEIKIRSKYKEYKKLFNTYVSNNKKIVGNINKKIKEVDGDVYLFGAHIFSQMLLSLGLDEKRIEFILDNSKIKENKRLYGTDLIVKSPNYIKNKEKQVIILRAGAYQGEIKSQIKQINKDAIFIE